MRILSVKTAKGSKKKIYGYGIRCIYSSRHYMASIQGVLAGHFIRVSMAFQQAWLGCMNVTSLLGEQQRWTRRSTRLSLGVLTKAGVVCILLQLSRGWVISLLCFSNTFLSVTFIYTQKRC
ncbi:hypothetical protein F4803DRAFT_244320 [Xylaria telfairii]|nr:hypothetical protein F4803DRAFT_244320 [Xylaria telfairii]